MLDCIPAYVYNRLMYSVKEAAQKLGLDTSQVRRLLAKGEIKGVKLARDWVVLELTYKRRRKPKTKRELQ
jgi:excisionase family DNA binding protein